MPEATTDWFATEPENGVGLLLTQFHESPPSAPVCAPAGTASSTQSTKFVMPEVVLVDVRPGSPLVEVPGPVFVVVLPGPELVVVVTTSVPLPAASQVARPLKAVKDIPRTVAPSKPTALAGTYRDTQWPFGGNVPI